MAKDAPKTDRIVVRLTPEDRRLLERAARADELDLTTWVRRIAVRAARQWETEQSVGNSGTPSP
jgi:uncharacterized protein (DUF1778 family)